MKGETLTCPCGTEFVYAGKGMKRCKPCTGEVIKKRLRKAREKPQHQAIEINHKGYDILLLKKGGFGYCGVRKKWYIKFQIRRKGEPKFAYETKYLDEATEEEAMAERERFCTAALLRGAGWVEKSTTRKRPLKQAFQAKKRMIEDKDLYIQPYTITRQRFYVKIDGKIVKQNIKTRVEARQVRDDFLLGGAKLMLCALCKKRPRWVRYANSTGSASLIHDEPGCPNRMRISDKDMDAVTKLKAWNLRFADGSRPGWGLATAEDIYKLGVFDNIITGKTKGGPKRRAKEEEVFDDISLFE